MTKVLVTGAAGFMGSHVADACLNLGFEVHGIDDLSGGFLENVPADVRFAQLSLLDAKALDELVRREQFRYIYHLAAYAAEGLSHFIRRFSYTNNVIGSANVINASVRHDVDCVVFTSSIAVYGAGQTPMKESILPRPEDPYGIAKYAVEQDLAAAMRVFGLRHVIFRPHNVYGERQNIADRYRNVLGIFFRQALTGEPFTIFGDGLQTRAFTCIGDIAPVIGGAPLVDAALGRTFNIGSDEIRTVIDVAKLIADVMDVPLRVRHLPARSEVVHAFSDHGLAREVFGTFAVTTLDAGVRKMADWVKRTGLRHEVEFRALEVEKNLPEIWRRDGGGSREVRVT